MAQSIDSTTVQKYTFFKSLAYCSSHIYIASYILNLERRACHVVNRYGGSIVKMRWFYRAIGGGAWPVMRSHVSWCTKAMRVSLLRQKQYYVVWDDGEPKCEIMVASSVWEGAALWFDVSLLITTIGPVRVGCVPPAVLHCYLVLDTSTRLLYVPHVGDRKYRIHEREHRRRCILQNSWKGAT